jgi:transcriptional regulator with PAS, ATPase and Fis domain
MVESGAFREDLFYRLNVVHITLPPLRERRRDISPLVDHLIQRLNGRLGTSFTGVEGDALRVLVSRPWKGNVRELENVLERAMILGEGDVIRAGHLAADVAAPAATARPMDLREAVREFERRHILDVIESTRFDKRQAARLLGISLASLYRKLDVGAPACVSED